MIDQTSTFPHIFVINLEHSAERRSTMSARLDPLGRSYSFFAATNGSQLDLETLPSYSKLWRRLFFGRDLTKGEMGCLLSHRAVYQHMVDKNIQNAIVLEDDVFVAVDFPDVINALLTETFAWDVIRFLGREKVYRTSRRIGPLCGLYRVTGITGTPGGAYGYLLNQNAAREFLKHMQKNWLPVDILHGHVWRTDLDIFAIQPSPVIPDTQVESTIGATRFDKTVQLTGWQRAVYPFTRCSFNVYKFARKHFSSLGSWPRDLVLRKRLAGETV